MKSIKILGSGCAKCNKLYDMADQAASQMGIEYEMEKVTKIMKRKKPTIPRSRIGNL